MDALNGHVHRYEAASDPALPTLLLLHGTGGDQGDLLPLGRMILPGAAMLGVRGNVLEQGARRYFRRLAEGVFDMDDLHRRTADLAQFIRRAADRYGISTQRLYALGFSNGANVAASVLLTHPDVLAGGVLMRAMTPFEPDSVPDLSGCAVLISEGTFDRLIPRASGERLSQLLTEAGADVELVWQSASHQLTAEDVRSAQNWFTQRLALGDRSSPAG